MQRTPPGSPSSSPTPGSSKGKGIGKGASNRDQDPRLMTKLFRESEDEYEPGDALFDNRYAKYSLEEINVDTRKQRRNLRVSSLFFSAPFNMEIAASMSELIDNLTNFYRTLELTADAASIIYQHEILTDRLHGLEKDHIMLKQLHKYVNSSANVKLKSTLNQRFANPLVVDNQPHPVLAFKPKPLSKDSTPDKFVIWKDNFERTQLRY